MLRERFHYKRATQTLACTRKDEILTVSATSCDRAVGVGPLRGRLLRLMPPLQESRPVGSPLPRGTNAMRAWAPRPTRRRASGQVDGPLAAPRDHKIVDSVHVGAGQRANSGDAGAPSRRARVRTARGAPRRARPAPRIFPCHGGVSAPGLASATVASGGDRPLGPEGVVVPRTGQPCAPARERDRLPGPRPGPGSPHAAGPSGAAGSRRRRATGRRSRSSDREPGRGPPGRTPAPCLFDATRGAGAATSPRPRRARRGR